MRLHANSSEGTVVTCAMETVLIHRDNLSNAGVVERKNGAIDCMQDIPQKPQLPHLP